MQQHYQTSAYCHKVAAGGSLQQPCLACTCFASAVPCTSEYLDELVFIAHVLLLVAKVSKTKSMPGSPPLTITRVCCCTQAHCSVQHPSCMRTPGHAML